MLGLPKTTEFNKRIPKDKFLNNLSLTPAIKKLFREQIRMIYWRNKIATSTVNLAAGEAVTEFQVFEIYLNQPELDEKVLTQIDKTVPYHILFVLTYDDMPVFSAPITIDENGMFTIHEITVVAKQ